MATNTTIKTRIQLRNDTLANWESSSLKLAAGEVAIASVNSTLAEVRVGTGNSTWATARKLNIGTDQVSGLTDMISTLVGDGAKKYQVVENGEGGNSWKLQEAALSGGEWADVTGSTWTVDFTAVNDAINGLTADVDFLSGKIDDANDAITGLTADVNFLSGQIDATNDTLNTVSSDYLTSTDKTELTNSIATKLASADFAALSAAIGLDAASESNKVATLSDIADLAGAMHFRGAVTPNEGETDQEAIARVITDPAAGDVVIITTTSKEYVYANSSWVELGDEVLYLTKQEASETYATITAANQMSAYAYNQASAYTDGQIEELSGTVDTLVAEVSAATLTAANNYADSAITTAVEALDVAADENGNADAGFVTTVTEADGVVSVSKKTIQLSDITDYDATISAYALSADVDALVAAVSADTVETVVGASADLSSADTVYGAKKYTDDKVDELTNGFLILNCGTASLREDEPEAPFSA